MPLKVYYSDVFTLPLPDGHRFPMQKYRMLRDELVLQKILKVEELFESPLATQEQILLAHTERYANGIFEGTLPERELKAIGFPWSQHLVRRSLATVGGAIAAATSALENGISGQLAGGTHHAHADRGGGYCVFNDLAIAARVLLSRAAAPLKRIAIVDLDVHQGDGNSSILEPESKSGSVYILSFHGERNYPFRKVPSTVDVAWPDGTGDTEYLEGLTESLEAVWDYRPELILYQAGVDPLKEDRLGKLNLSYDGLRQRDEMVLEGAEKRGIPVSIAMGGGYADPIDLTVRAHIGTYQVIQRVFGINGNESFDSKNGNHHRHNRNGRSGHLPPTS